MQKVKKYVIITAAAFVYAVGVSLFTDPNNMAPGGVTGIAIILSRIFPVSTGTFIMLINIPILIFAIWKFGLALTVSTIYATALISFFTNLLAAYGAATDDILLAALVGGTLTAVSIGVIFRAGATTGGMDIIVKALRLQFPHLKTGKIFFIADALVVTLSGIVFRDLNAALYAAISAICTSVVMDIVLYGRDEARLLFIISAKAENIAERLLTDVDIGVTYIKGQGAYSGDNKRVIMCVVKKPVFGEGYKSYFSERM